MTFTIEPMLNLGTHEWNMWDDNWTVVTRDGRASAQFEHTLLVTDDGAEVLTLPDPAEPRPETGHAPATRSRYGRSVTSMFEDYATGMGAAYDEMYDVGARRSARRTASCSPRCSRWAPTELQTRVEALQSSYLDQGVTFDIGGEERAFPLDVLPRVIEMDQWAKVEAGVQQRVQTLEKFLDDLYDAGRVLQDGVVPRRVVTTSSHFHRAAAGIEPPNGVRVHVSGIDLIRDDDGEFRVLEDNVRVPSGVSYVMTNRRAIAAALPETFAEHRIRPVAGYPQKLLTALRAAAPAGVTDPNVVVLTPGVFNGAYFEHALLARTMGVELVEGRDLECRRGRVMMRTTQGLEPVHVIYRRVDDEFLDPVHFRSNSLLGCSGLINAARAGNVTIANAVGNGVADDKLIYTYLPDLVRYYLDEEPILKNVDTWRLGDADHREEVMDRLDELVLKPVDGSGGKGIVIGPQASQGRARRAAREGAAGPALVDRPAGDPAEHRADVRQRHDASPPRRPAPVRGQRRQPRLGAARRPDPGRARRGRADRELLARRRLEGHLGAGRPRPPHARAPSPSGSQLHTTPQDVGPALDSFSSQQDQQQQQAAAAEGVASC